MGTVISGGTPATDKSTYWGGDILWATPTDITALSSRFITATKRKITTQGLDESSAKLMPKGSLLVCTRATVGEMAISTCDISTNQGFKSLSPNDEFNVEFLYYLFCYNKHQFIRYACGSTFLELSKKDFEKRTFVVPHIDEQEKIVEMISNADAGIENQRAQLDVLTYQKKALMQQLLTGKRRVQLCESEGRCPHA
jgi:type I restriction enzyme S subunit